MDDGNRSPRALLAERRRRRALAALGIGGLVAVGAAVDAYHRRVKLRAAAASWSAAQRCLIGPPRRGGEPLEARLRRAELALNPDWPRRCTGLLDETAHQLRAARESRLRPLIDEFERVSRVIKHYSRGTVHRLSAVDPIWRPLVHLWEAADAAHLPEAPPASSPAPPVLTDPLMPETVPSLADAEHLRIRFESVPSRSVRFALPRVSTACALLWHDDPARALATARCGRLELPEMQGDWLAVMDADDAVGPVVSVRDDRVGGTYDAATGARLGPYGYDGFAHADGTVTLLERGRPIALTQWQHGRPTDRLALQTPAGEGVDLVGDHLARCSASAPGRCTTRVVRSTGETLGPEAAFPIATRFARSAWRACRTPDALFVSVDAVDLEPGADPGTRPVQLTAHIAGAWSPPVRADVAGRFHCAGREAGYTWIETREAASPRDLTASVRQVRCTPERCSVAAGDVGLLTPDIPNRVEVGALGSQVVLVWVHRNRAVYMRVAPLDRLATTRDVAIFDPGSEAILSLALETRPGLAVLFVRTERHLHALRIDSDGRVTAVRRAD